MTLQIDILPCQAVQCQHERCVNILLENHANPNLVDVNGNTALHLAANIPSISTAVLLLEHEADINAQNKVIFVHPAQLREKKYTVLCRTHKLLFSLFS